MREAEYTKTVVALSLLAEVRQTLLEAWNLRAFWEQLDYDLLNSALRWGRARLILTVLELVGHCHWHAQLTQVDDLVMKALTLRRAHLRDLLLDVPQGQLSARTRVATKVCRAAVWYRRKPRKRESAIGVHCQIWNVWWEDQPSIRSTQTHLQNSTVWSTEMRITRRNTIKKQPLVRSLRLLSWHRCYSGVFCIITDVLLLTNFTILCKELRIYLLKTVHRPHTHL